MKLKTVEPRAILRKIENWVFKFYLTSKDFQKMMKAQVEALVLNSLKFHFTYCIFISDDQILLIIV